MQQLCNPPKKMLENHLVEDLELMDMSYSVLLFLVAIIEHCISSYLVPNFSYCLRRKGLFCPQPTRSALCICM